jgi:hypothetical protein
MSGSSMRKQQSVDRGRRALLGAGGVLMLGAILQPARLWGQGGSPARIGIIEGGEELILAEACAFVEKDAGDTAGDLSGNSGAAAVTVLLLLGLGGGIIQVPVMTLVCGVPFKAAAARNARSPA